MQGPPPKLLLAAVSHRLAEHWQHQVQVEWSLRVRWLMRERPPPAP